MSKGKKRKWNPKSRNGIHEVDRRILQSGKTVPMEDQRASFRYKLSALFFLALIVGTIYGVVFISNTR